jgi:hypothetical protein
MLLLCSSPSSPCTGARSTLAAQQCQVVVTNFMQLVEVLVYFIVGSKYYVDGSASKDNGISSAPQFATFQSAIAAAILL